MHYLFWTLLNIGLLLYGLYFLVRIFYLVREKYGLLKSIFALLFLFSMCSDPKPYVKENTLIIGKNSKPESRSTQKVTSGSVSLSPMQSILVMVSLENYTIPKL